MIARAAPRDLRLSMIVASLDQTEFFGPVHPQAVLTGRFEATEGRPVQRWFAAELLAAEAECPSEWGLFRFFRCLGPSAAE